MATILNYLKKLLENPVFLLTILLVLVSAFAINSCNNLNKLKLQNKEIVQRNERNMAAMNDSVRRVWNKSTQQYESLKLAYTVENQKALEQYDKKLAYEINKMGKGVIDYLKVAGKVSLDDTSLSNDVVKYSDNKYGLKWNMFYKDAGFSQDIVGVSNFNLFKELKTTPTGTDINIKVDGDSTKITKNVTSIKLAFAHKEVKKDGKKYYEVIATSPSDKVVFDSISSVYFIENLPCPDGNPKVRRITLGPYVGAGLSLGFFQVGIGAQYNLRWSDIGNIFKKK